MANIKDDPKVQELLAKVETKAEATQIKAVKAALNEAGRRAGEAATATIADAKAAGSPKELLAALSSLKRVVQTAIKEAA